MQPTLVISVERGSVQRIMGMGFNPENLHVTIIDYDYGQLWQAPVAPMDGDGMLALLVAEAQQQNCHRLNVRRR